MTLHKNPESNRLNRNDRFVPDLHLSRTFSRMSEGTYFEFSKKSGCPYSNGKTKHPPTVKVAGVLGRN